MPKMKKLDRTIVMDAAAICAKQDELMSWALEDAGANEQFISYILMDFLNICRAGDLPLSLEELQNARVLALLTFAEIGLTDE